ncbi:MAG: hypothetical protein ABWY77_07980 [Acidimicrobiia bacterium]
MRDGAPLKQLARDVDQGGMEISFEVAGKPAEFRRTATTGAAELVVGDEVVKLANPLNPGTHFSVKTEESWKTQIGDTTVEIVKKRPLLVGGLRNNTYTVLVDDDVVAIATGT